MTKYPDNKLLTAAITEYILYMYECKYISYNTHLYQITYISLYTHYKSCTNQNNTLKHFSITHRDIKQ